MPFETILFEITDRVAYLTLNRPDKLNAFTGRMHAELREAMDRVRSSGDTRALVLTGSGRGFCAGQDLSERVASEQSGAFDLGASLEKNYNPLIKGLHELPMPVICAVNGVRPAPVAISCSPATSSSRRARPASSRYSAVSA